MKKYPIVIVHFSPIELYPPVQNLLKELSKSEVRVLILTTTNKRFFLPTYGLPSKKFKVIRLGKITRNSFIISRLINYVIFHGAAFLTFVFYRPKSVLYFETLSSFAACIYKWLVKDRVKMFVHYHEYTSPERYKTIPFEYFMHRIERKLYRHFQWVSHTTEQRMVLFESDIQGGISTHARKILPNYPPLNWKRSPKPQYHVPLRIVYVGALSLTSMYTHEFIEWVVTQGGAVTVDFYTYNYSSDAKKYIERVDLPWIRIHDGVTYQELPSILPGFDVGVILYNGHIPNFVYNAPNKLFEYFACGLDVWFPDVMLGSLPYAIQKGKPKIVPISFMRLEDMKLQHLLSCDGGINDITFSCEEVLAPLVQKLLKAVFN